MDGKLHRAQTLTSRLLPRPDGRRPIIRLLTVSLCLVSMFVIVNRSKIFLPVWMTTELGTITATGGPGGYKAATGRNEVRGHYYLSSLALLVENGRLRLWRPYSSHHAPHGDSHWLSSSAALLEDGRLLAGPANAPLEDIVNYGAGRYNTGKGQAIFSTSDNSSPLSNGRRYSAASPWIVGTAVALPIYLVTIALLLLLGAAHARQLLTWLEFHPLAVSLIIFLGVFTFTRGPFYLDYSLIGLAPDTSSYLEPINQFRRGELPLVSIRPPGYPLFIYLTTLLDDRWLTVIIGQSLLSLGAGLLLIWAIHRGYRTLTIPAAVAISGFIGNSRFIYYETSALSESVYTSFLMLTFGWLVAGLHSRRSLPLLLASLCGGLAILIKPAGIYLLVVFMIVAVFLLINRYSRRALLATLAPLLLLVAGLAVYNRYTVGELVVSTFGECQLGAATAHFWQPDPAFPAHVNDQIRNELPASLARCGLDAAALETIATTWNPRRLSELFEKYYDRIIYVEGWTFGSRFGAGYEESRPLIRKISLKSIAKRPRHYLKFVWSSFATYYLILQWKLDLYHSLNERADEIFQKTERSYSAEAAKEFRSIDESGAPRGVLIAPQSARTSLKATRWQRLHLAWEGISNEIFNNVLWIVVSLPIFMLALWRLLQSRLRDVPAFILVVAFLSILGSSLVVSLIQLGIERYSYPNHFLIYLAPALLPSIWRVAGEWLASGWRVARPRSSSS